MHQRADANSRPDGDRARQRDPCMRTCVYACASPCAIGHLRPLLPPPGYVPLLTRTNETRGSTFGAQRIVEGTRMVRNVRLEEREQLFPRDTLSRVTWNRRRYSFAHPFVANFHLPFSLYPLRPPCHPFRVCIARIHVWKIRKLVVRFGRDRLKKRRRIGESVDAK